MNWATLLAVLLGAGITIATEWLRDRRGVEAERRARREDFEIEQLVQLHSTLRELVDVTDEIASYSAPHRAVFGEPGQRYRALARRATWLQGLVLDDALRASVEAARSGLRPVRSRADDSTVEELIAQDEAMRERVDSCLEAISQRIREIYKGAVTTP
jgi:hypothetical protein